MIVLTEPACSSYPAEQMVLVCAIVSLGFILRLVLQGPCVPVPVPLSGASFCFAKSSEKWFCEIVEDPWWFLDEFLWVLSISFPVFFKFEDFGGFFGAAGPPVPVVFWCSLSLCFAGA